MSVARLHMPATGCEAGRNILGKGNAGWAVDGDGIVVVENDQFAKAQMTGKADRFLTNAFLKAAVTDDHISIVIYEIITELICKTPFGQGHADGGRNPLAKRAGGGFDAFGVTMLGMTCGYRAPLPEISDLLDRHVFIAAQVQQAVEEHGGMTV